MKVKVLFLDVGIEVRKRCYLHKPRVGDISQSSQEVVRVEGQCLRSNCEVDVLSIGTVRIDANVHHSNTS